MTRTRKQHIGALVSKVAHQCRYGTGGEQPAQVDAAIELLEQMVPTLLKHNHPHTGV
ncbi:hypothetical protein R2Q26_12495 [Nitrosomonas sp. Is37]|nr:hypothetical protein [Nitrosomonas sp. Is37]